MRELTVGVNDAGQRLDKFITKTLDLPMSLLYKAIRTKKIKLNRKRAEINTKLKVGDTVQLFISEDFFKEGTERQELSNITPHLSIVYEDENILLLDKSPGISVHEDEHTAKNTLITHIQAYLYQKGEYNPDIEQSFAPALCNRIDKNTGGIVIAAKNSEALRIMNEKIKLREIDKRYLAAVHGIPEKKSDTLRGYLLKDEKTNTVKVYDKNPPRAAKSIETKYTVIATAGHPIDPELRKRCTQYNKEVHIGNNCWLGANVVVMPGVTIGDNTVIGAGSIVTKDIPSGVVAVGNPCRVLRPVGERDKKYFYKNEEIDWENL